MMNYRIIFYTLSLLFFVFIFYNCNDSDEVRINVSTTDSSLIVKNISDINIYSVSFEQQTSALINWAQSCDSSISPNETKEVIYTNIYGYSDSCKVVVFYWKCTADQPDNLYYLLIQTE